jgi:hypothetical protein
MSSDVRLGYLIGREEKRDAIHIAIAPVVASHDIAPGQPIGFVRAGDSELVGIGVSPVGIADPFLKEVVAKGERFWMFLNPNTITSLRHEWTHPLFSDAPSEDDLFIKFFAAKCGVRVERLLDNASYYADDDSHYLHMGENEDYKDVTSAEWDRFWAIFEQREGKAPKDKGSFFSCSC